LGDSGRACAELGVGGEGGGQVKAVISDGGGALRVDLRGADEGVGDGGGHVDWCFVCLVVALVSGGSGAGGGGEVGAQREERRCTGLWQKAARASRDSYLGWYYPWHHDDEPVLGCVRVAFWFTGLAFW